LGGAIVYAVDVALTTSGFLKSLAKAQRRKVFLRFCAFARENLVDKTDRHGTFRP
jgi:hypothetical protein